MPAESFTCTVCGEEKLTEERAAGRRQCKPCYAAKMAVRSAAYRAANKDQIAAKNHRLYVANRDQVLARSRRRRSEMKVELAAYAQSYYAANKDRLMQLERVRKQQDPEAFIRRRRAYRRANPEKVAEASRRYHARRRGAVEVETGVTWSALVERDGPTCTYCGIECDQQDGHHRIARDGANRWVCGPTYPTVDHVVPVSLGGHHTMANTVLACNLCNKRKGARKVN